jgi:hypothetical protein
MPAFISHSHKDEAFYSTLCLALDGAGIPRWDVASLAPGSSLADQLRTAIGQCEVCIFLATRRSIESQWCLAELGAFWGAGKRVIVYLGDPEKTEKDMPPQFQGNLWASSARQLLDTVRALCKPVQTYDIFLAAPMAAYQNEDEYQAARSEVLKVCDAFREHCGFNVYCAVEQCLTMKSFQAADVSVRVDLKAIRNAQNFVMLYPKKMSSSILFEAGFALAIRKYSLYFAANRKDLPYMLQDAASVFPDVYMHELPCSSNYDCIVDEIRINKKDLFQWEC